MNLEKSVSGNHLCREKTRQDFQITRTTRGEVQRPGWHQKGGKALLLLGGWAAYVWHAQTRPCYVKWAHDTRTYTHGFTWQLTFNPRPWKSRQYWASYWLLSIWLRVQLTKMSLSFGYRAKLEQETAGMLQPSTSVGRDPGVQKASPALGSDTIPRPILHSSGRVWLVF